MHEKLHGHVPNSGIYTLTYQLHQLRDHFQRKMTQIHVEEEEPFIAVRVRGDRCYQSW